MTILIGILLYSVCVMFFCALTRANGRDETETLIAPKREERFEPAPARGTVHAREIQL